MNLYGGSVLDMPITQWIINMLQSSAEIIANNWNTDLEYTSYY